MKPLPRSRFLRSLAAALAGLRSAVASEANLRIHFLLLAVAVGLGLWLGLAPLEWVAVVLASGLVIGLELLNTAIEGLADAIHPERSEAIKQVKDIAAAAVLIAALAAVAVGAIVFLPKLWEWLPLS
ncbi:MAG: diacylglycerol kinase family protein [Verrucomicrobiota bacterium]